MSLYNSDGQMRLTSVVGDTYTGLVNTDGSWNIVINDGTGLTGLYHSCGALNAVVVTNDSSGYHAANGSMNVMLTSSGEYTPSLFSGSDTGSVSFIRSDSTYRTADTITLTADYF